MMAAVARFWQEMQPLEEPQEGNWCPVCLVPSVATRRFMHSMHANEAVTYAQVLTLVHCRDCTDTYWKEYREQQQQHPERDADD